MQESEDLEKINEEFGDQVRHYREKRRWNQSQLADVFGKAIGKTINPTTITRIEKGTRPTPLNEIYALAKVLNVSVNDLLPGESQYDRLMKSLIRSFQDSMREYGELEFRLKKLDNDISFFENAYRGGIELERFTRGITAHSLEHIHTSAKDFMLGVRAVDRRLPPTVACHVFSFQEKLTDQMFEFSSPERTDEEIAEFFADLACEQFKDNVKK